VLFTKSIRIFLRRHNRIVERIPAVVGEFLIGKHGEYQTVKWRRNVVRVMLSPWHA
jgi:hypothetical protein